MVLHLQGRIVTTIAGFAPYPYYRDYTARNALHTTYTELFDPINTRGTWRSITLPTELLDLQVPEDQDEMATKVGDHYYAHFDYSSQTRAVQCHHDAFFTTPEGNIGLCPAPAKIGDTIVVLDGGNVPYLLRAEDGEGSKLENGQYKFVGECYLDGYMYGRAMEENDGHEVLPIQVFDLI
jgi:hypothetical protein